VAEDEDTGEIPVVEPLDPATLQRQVLAELQSIRYRLGVLVVWFVVLPIAGGLIALVVLSSQA
jgi:hypothetical protein